MEFDFENSGIPVKAYFSQENVEEIFLPLLRRLTELQREKEEKEELLGTLYANWEKMLENP